MAVGSILGGSVGAQDDRPATDADRGIAPADNRYRFPVWHADFPMALELPSAALPQVYQRSRRQALERVAANLQGNTRREVWLMATDFFSHAPDDAAEVLIAAMDRALGQATASMQDVLLNTIEAMARMGSPAFEEPLRRALEHPNDAVRQGAYTALGVAGSAATLRSLFPVFLSSMNGRARTAWLQGARQRLGRDAVSLIKQTMATSTPVVIRDLILKEVLKFEPVDAAEILEATWADAAGEFKAIVAGVFHAAGRAAGSVWLHNALIDADTRLVLQALQQLRGRELGILRDDVMRCSTHDNPDVHLELAKTLAGRPGDDVTRVYEILAGATELIETKSLALRELTQRGSTDAVTTLLEDVKTATGTRLELILRLLSASGDERIVPVLLDRFESAPVDEGRSFLQALSTSQAKGAANALLDLLITDDRMVTKPDSHGQQLTTWTYVPLLLLNVRGEEPIVVKAWPRIPAHDHRRRSMLLNTLTGFASDRRDPALAASVWSICRAVLFDTAELPQLRIQALNALARRAIDMDDVRQLRRHQEADGPGESPQMRALFKDYLFEYF